jgi:hypothetical protein
MTNVSHLNARSPNWLVGVFCLIALSICFFGLVHLLIPVLDYEDDDEVEKDKLKDEEREEALFALLTPNKITGARTKSLFYCAEQLQFPLLHVVGQRSVIQL